MSEYKPATQLTAPIKSVEIFTYIGTGAEGPIPHTFLEVTEANGKKDDFGFAPQITGLVGTGQIFNNIGHLSFNSSGPISLNSAQGQRLEEYINQSIKTPPYYTIPSGSQCAVWAANGVNYSLYGIQLPRAISTLINSTNPLNAYEINPYGMVLQNIILRFTLAVQPTSQPIQSVSSEILYSTLPNTTVPQSDGTHLLIADAANVTLVGGSGNDTFVGGMYNCSAIGGTGADTFDYIVPSSGSTSNAMTINGKATDSIFVAKSTTGSTSQLTGPGSDVNGVLSSSDTNTVWTGSDGTTYTYTPSFSPMLGVLTITTDCGFLN
jgi:hypothetical protein